MAIDFQQLLQQIGPMAGGIPGMGNASAMPAPLPMMPAQPMLPNVPPTAAPMAQPQPEPAPRGVDLLKQLAPMVLMAFTSRKNPHASAALMQGLIQGQEAARARQMQAEDRESERKQLAARYMQQVAAQAAQFEDPEQFQQYLAFAEQVGEGFGIAPGTLRQIPFPANKQAEKIKKAAAERLAQIERDERWATQIGTPEFEDGISVTLPGVQGKKTIRELRALAGMEFYKGGQAIAPPKGTPKAVNLQPDDLKLQAKARELGKPVDQLTTAEINQALAKPPDPTLQAIRELTLAQGQQRAANAPALPPAQQRRVDTLARGFDNQQAVKRVGTQAEAVNFANSLDLNTKNPADDQALIYAFAKAMDPESVVREGEYATVQKYAQSWAQSFGFNAARIFSNTPFLTPAARANMKATIQSKFAANRKTYDNLRRSYVERINRITGSNDGDSYLTDYAGGFPQDAPKAGGGPQVGERRMFNGQVGEWDGKGWKPVQ